MTIHRLVSTLVAVACAGGLWSAISTGSSLGVPVFLVFGAIAVAQLRG